MKKNILLVFLIVFAMMLASACGSANSKDNTAPPKEEQAVEAGQDNSDTREVTPEESDLAAPEVGINVGNIAPDFTLKDLNGNEVTLSKLKGKKVFLNFWTTECPYCRMEMPEINRFYKEYGDKILIYGINLGEDTEKVKQFISENKLDFPILMDSDLAVGYVYNIYFIPESMFIDENGVIKAVVNSAMNYDQMVAYLENMDKPE
ncbi:MAG: TlpA disulfide reductase family protein [Thermoanaerobacteraceae bacterium]|nr:TlpA disulfide reductase family protein [Thermoanaerobacteraceae bacterium]